MSVKNRKPVKQARKPARKPYHTTVQRTESYVTSSELERYVNSLDAECKDLRAYNEDLESKVAGLTLRCDAIASNLINTKALLDKDIERVNENLRALAVKTHDELSKIVVYLGGEL